MGSFFTNKEIEARNMLLLKQIQKQEQMLKLLVLNTKMIINTLSPYIDNKELVKKLTDLLDQQERLVNQGYNDQNDFEF